LERFFVGIVYFGKGADAQAGRADLATHIPVSDWLIRSSEADIGVFTAIFALG